MSTFQNLNLHFPTTDAYAAWLFQHPKPTWGVEGSTYHNTYIPNRAQWRGRASMESMAATYAAKGWSTGPHVYLATGTAFDGIFVMCPPWQAGIHAMNSCNQKRFGIENVDDWNVNRPTDAQKALLVDVTAINHRWAGIGANLNAHRDCVTRTCPGQYGYAMKSELQTRLAMALNTTRLEPDTPPGIVLTYTSESPLMARPTGTSDAYTAAWLKRCSRANYDDYSIRVIASAYWTECARLGLDAWLVAAQVMHETGNLGSWWCARPRRNPAGISVTGETQPRSFKPISEDWQFDETANVWKRGLAFNGWLSDSLPAHLGRLLAYAVLPSQQTIEQANAVRTALSYRSLPTVYWGMGSTLKNLEGRWVYPGRLYGAKLAEIANAMRGAV